MNSKDLNNENYCVKEKVDSIFSVYFGMLRVHAIRGSGAGKPLFCAIKTVVVTQLQGSRAKMNSFLFPICYYPNG